MGLGCRRAGGGIVVGRWRGNGSGERESQFSSQLERFELLWRFLRGPGNYRSGHAGYFGGNSQITLGDLSGNLQKDCQICSKRMTAQLRMSDLARLSDFS